MTTKLVLGPDPGDLILRMVTGDPWAASLTLKTAGAPTAWPVQPVLEFLGGPITWISTLSAADSKATWGQDEDDVAAVLALSNRAVRLVVGGVTWWSGSVQRRA